MKKVHLEIYQLYCSTDCAVSHAQLLARAGQKDEARKWFNYIFNARVFKILSHYQGAMPIDLDSLERKFKALADEVHPQTVHREDFSEIAARLDVIAYGVSEILKSTRKKGRR